MTWQELNEVKLALLHPLFAQRVRDFLAALAVEGIIVLITQGRRTWAEQHAIWLEGRDEHGNILNKKEIKTNADEGHSQHNFCLAVDLCPDDPTLAGFQLDWNIKHPAWQRMLELAPHFKLAEGAQWRTFPDNPHFYPAEIPATTVEIRQVYASGGQDAVNKWFEEKVAA